MSEKKTLRNKFKNVLISKSDLPIIVYLTVVFSLIIIWRFRAYNADLSLNLFSELLGAAFTLFVIDSLVVRSRNKLWKVVHNDIDYIIARYIYRIRDGIATRVFDFEPELYLDDSVEKNTEEIHRQRAELVNELANL